MSKFLYLIFITILLKSSPIHTAHCTLGADGWCTFYGVWATEAQTYFNPTTEDPDAILNMKFENSRMTSLTNEICSIFPNLKRLELKNLSMEKIEKGALDNCHELHTIGFWNNKIKEIDEDTFKYNSALEAIHFQNNRIEKIEPNTFSHLSRLSILDFSENYLTGFPVFKMDQILSLKKLFLDTNEITDIDEGEFMLKFPNLEVIYLNDNPFDCTRLRSILKKFKENKLQVTRWGPQYRHYGLTVVGEADCSDETKISALSEETQWIRQKTDMVNVSLNHDLYMLRLKVDENMRNHKRLYKNFNETAGNLSKGLNHTQEEQGKTNRQLGNLKKDLQKFKKEEMDRDTKIIQSVTNLELKLKKLQDQTNKNEKVLSEALNSIGNTMKELALKLDELKTQLNEGNSTKKED